MMWNNFHDFFHTLGMDLEIPEKQLSEIADSMAEWEEIAVQLKLTLIDVEEIKIKHPQKFKLQK